MVIHLPSPGSLDSSPQATTADCHLPEKGLLLTGFILKADSLLVGLWEAGQGPVGLLCPVTGVDTSLAVLKSREQMGSRNRKSTPWMAGGKLFGPEQSLTEPAAKGH